MTTTPKGFAPFAINKNIPPGSNDPQIKPRVAILHVDAGDAFSLYDYFKNRSGGIESHFHVRKDGEVEQYRSIYYQADANLDANDFAVSIETQGLGEGEWNAAQLATIKRLLVWLHDEAGIPLVKAAKWDGSGIAYHTLFGAPSHYTPVAKSCPGPDRIKQFNAVLVPWMKAALDKPEQESLPEVSLSKVQRAAKIAGWSHRIGNESVREDARLVRQALKAEKCATYQDWQTKAKVKPVNGVPDFKSLVALGKAHGFQVRK